jgi:hypothetical protein
MGWFCLNMFSLYHSVISSHALKRQHNSRAHELSVRLSRRLVVGSAQFKLVKLILWFMVSIQGLIDFEI